MYTVPCGIKYKETGQVSTQKQTSWLVLHLECIVMQLLMSSGCSISYDISSTGPICVSPVLRLCSVHEGLEHLGRRI